VLDVGTSFSSIETEKKMDISVKKPWQDNEENKKLRLKGRKS
jgi:hypothetical protein